jgi:ADP-heptose:LPS heptosyltransferase
MVKVSIIVPVYNAEKYLKRCLGSIVNQTLKDIEIICIDDGSTDNSLAILNDYAQRDFRVKVLHQENAKQGAARNRGLEIATGEFVTFVDSDDWVELDYCELLYNAAIKHNVNIAASSTTRDYEHKVKHHLKLTEGKTYYGANSIVKALKNNLITHSKLYRFQPIKELRFEENVLYEDGPYTLKAFNIEQSLVTVPNARYHYYSNPTSTIKQKLNPKLENDKISTSLQTIRYAKAHNIDIGDFLLIKYDHFLWSIKHYYDRKDYYLFGIKVFSKKIPYNNVKNFIVFNTACFGDVLLCNSLCQNIKNIFPESRIIFVCDKDWKDIAKYQESIDEVIVYDKKGKHKGLFGFFKFIKEFPYKDIYASLVTYKNERNIAVAKLLKSKFIFTQNNLNKKLPTQERHNLLLSPLTNKPIINYPIKFNLPDKVVNPLNTIIANEKYIVLCCISKNPIKNIPIEIARDLINKIISSTDKKIVLVGVGKTSQEFATLLEKECNFINLVDKTNLLELGQVLKESDLLISVDTGTMHYAYSLGVKTLGIFFEEKTFDIWGPKKEIYPNTIVINKNINVDKIYQSFNELRGYCAKREG